MTEPLGLAELRKLCDDPYETRDPRVKRGELAREGQLNAERMKAIVDEAIRRDPSQPMLADEKRRYDKHKVALDLIDIAIKTPTASELRDSASAKLRREDPRIFGGGSDYLREDREQEQVRRFLAGEGPRQLRVPVAKAMQERELVRNGMDPREARTLVWDTGSVGSGVPTLMAKSIYEVLEDSVAMLRMPTTKISTESGANMDFPRLTTHVLGTQVIAQGTAIGGSDPVFAKTTFGAFKYGALIQVANEVIEDTAFDVLDLVARDSARAVGRLVDADLVVGTGTGEPLGAMNSITAGTVATGGSLVTPTYEKLIDLAFSVNGEYRNSGNAAWLMRDSTAGTLMKLRDGGGGTEGAPLWQTTVTGGIADYGQPPLLLGYAAYTDPNVASMASNSKIIAFGDWSAYYVRHVGDVVLERSDDYAFDKDLVTFRCRWLVDGDLLDTSAINLMRQNVT